LVILTIFLWKLIPEINSSGYGFWKLLIVVFVGVDLLGAWWGYHQNVESSFYKTVFAEGMQVESTSEQSRILWIQTLNPCSNLVGFFGLVIFVHWKNGPTIANSNCRI
jgi:hypothetical protein